MRLPKIPKYIFSIIFALDISLIPISIAFFDKFNWRYFCIGASILVISLIIFYCLKRYYKSRNTKTALEEFVSNGMYNLLVASFSMSFTYIYLTKEFAQGMVAAILGIAMILAIRFYALKNRYSYYFSKHSKRKR